MYYKMIDERLNKLRKSEISRFNFYVDDARANSFSEWINWMQELNSPEILRNGLYYGFQPLFDILVEDTLKDENVKPAIESLEKIAAASKKYYSSYYLGNPDISRLKDDIEDIAPGFYQIDSERYVKKLRNIDFSQTYAQNIKNYLEEMLSSVVQTKQIPNLGVGCACGSSEIAFALGGIFNIDVMFLRYSKRRNDKKPKKIQHYENQLEEKVKNSDVLCVEDYVDSGESLRAIMSHLLEMEPKSVVGTSVVCSRDQYYLKKEYSGNNFHRFKLN